MPGPPVYLRRDPATGADIFQLDDGTELPVASGESPYARTLMAARPPAARDEAARIIADADAAARAPQPTPRRAAPPQMTFTPDEVYPPQMHFSETEVYGNTLRPGEAFPGALDIVRDPAVHDPNRPRATRFGAPPPPEVLAYEGEIPESWLPQEQAHAGMEAGPPPVAPIEYASLPGEPAPTPQSDVPIPPEWLTGSGSHPPNPRQGWIDAAREMRAADPSVPPRYPVVERQSSQGGSDPAGAPVTDYTGGARSPASGRGGQGRGAAHATMAPQPPTLDQLMVPDGAAGPGLYGAVIDDMAGGPSALREQQRLGQWAIDNQQRRADAQRQGAEDARAAVEAGAQRQIELEQERQAAMGQARQRYDRALQRVQSMSIDPARMFRSAGGFGGVGAGIAVGLGAIGGAIAGDNGNSALPIIQENINRDIEAQRADMSNAQNGLSGELNLLQQIGQEFESREAAELATQAAMLQATEARIAEMIAGVESDDVQRQGQALMGQIREQYTAAQAAAFRAEEDRIGARRLQDAQTSRLEAQAARDRQRAAAAGRGPARPELDEHSIPGAIHDGRTDQSAADRSAVRNFVGRTSAALRAVRRAIQIRQEVGGEVLDRSAVARMTEARESIITSLRVIENTGVPQEHEMRRFESRVPDAASFTSIGVLEQLRALEESMTEAADAGITPYGYRLAFGQRAERERIDSATAAGGLQEVGDE